MAVRWDRKVRVLATDDSQVMRSMFHALFDPRNQNSCRDLPEMELCGVARDGIECLEFVEKLQPDVLLLDLEMPRLHGLDVLSRLRLQAPLLPAIMCSTCTERGARATLDGLSQGAADYVTKPAGQMDQATALRTLAEDLLPKIAALAGWSFMGSGINSRFNLGTGLATEFPAGRAGTAISAPMSRAMLLPPPPPKCATGSALAEAVQVITIGVSTGGPSALEKMLPSLPKSFPVPILIVQHMPKLFTGALAERLNRSCGLQVREAFDGAPVRTGTIWVAPGDAHMEVVQDRSGLGSIIQLSQGELRSQYKPAVDNLFGSASRRYGSGVLAVVMTGMGSDGLTGARQVCAAGGTVLVQDEATSAVWGMPARVAGAGLASAMLPLASIAGELTRRVGQRSKLHLLGDPGRAGRAMEGSDGLF